MRNSLIIEYQKRIIQNNTEISERLRNSAGSFPSKDIQNLHSLLSAQNKLAQSIIKILGG